MRTLIVLLMLFIPIIQFGQPRPNIALTPNDSLYANGVDLIYTYFPKDIISFAEGNELFFGENLYYVGLEQTQIENWHNGLTYTCFANWLCSNSTFKFDRDYKLKGIQLGMDMGGKKLLWNWFALEAMLEMQYSNFRINDRLTNSKLKNNNFLIGPEIGFRIVSKSPISLSFTTKYLWNVANPNWKPKKNFNSSLQADPLRLNGLYFSIKLGLYATYYS